MLFKLAINNIKKSIKDYTIYISTLILSIGLFYGFLAITSPEYAQNLPIEIDIEYFSQKMQMIVPALGILIVFLVAYINGYILRRKQKEFAIEMLVGLEKRHIALNLFIEISLLGVFTIIPGIVVGMLISQFVGEIVVEAFDSTYTVFLPLYKDIVIETSIYFCILFIILGIYNGLKLRKLTIAELLSKSKKYEDEFDFGKYIFKWILLNVLASLMILSIILMVGLKMFNSLKLNIEVLLAILFIISLAQIVVGINIATKIKRKKKIIGSFGFVISIFCFLQVGLLMFLMPMFEYVVSMGLFSMFFYTMPQLLLIILCLSGVVLFMGTIGMTGIWIAKKLPQFTSDNLFVYGQIRDKLQINCKLMAVLTIILTLSMFIIGWLPTTIERADGYLKERSVYDVQVFSRYNVVEKIDDLKYIQINKNEIEKSINKKGYQIENFAEVEAFYPEEEDFYKTANKDKPSLLIPLSDYNSLLKLSGYSPIELQQDEYAVAWDPSVLSEKIKESNTQSLKMTLGTEELSKNGDYQYNVGMGIFTSGMESAYIVPDDICKNLIRATIYYAANTKEELSVSKAKELETEILDKLNFKDSKEVDLFYTRFKSLQINEGVSNSLMMRLGGTYVCIILLLLCLAILSLHQITDSMEYKWRFNIIEHLGVGIENIHKYIRQQIYIWFGLPFLMSTFCSAGIFLYTILSNRDEYIPYISLKRCLMYGVAGYLGVAIIFIIYLVMTYIAFKRNIKIKEGYKREEKNAI